jgi:hypothetical protein
MVLVIAVKHAFQPFARSRHRIVHPAAEVLLDCLQFLPPPVAVGDAPDFESPQTVLRTNVTESQKGECLRFPFPAFLPVQPGKTPEPDQPSLVFVQFQSILAQLFPYICEELLRFVFMLKSNDGIIRVADDDNVALRLLPPLVCPLVEYVIQIGIR